MTDHPAFVHHPGFAHLQPILLPDERLEMQAVAGDAIVIVTDRRLAIADEHRLIMDTSFANIRRIQFDIERDRPATFVVVPDAARTAPEAIPVDPERYEDFGRAIAYIGLRLSGMELEADAV
jgi:hypothetical protein